LLTRAVLEVSERDLTVAPRVAYAERVLQVTPTIGTRAQQGEDTRRKILHLAMNLASKQGLETLTIGDLAKELGMSKSGLFAHFGSKEELQIATIGAAAAVFVEHIVTPAMAAKPGMARLQELLEGHLRYMESSVFEGGCFFSAVTAEFDDKPGRVRDKIVEMMKRWANLLATEVEAAQASGEIDPGVEALQVVFELNAATSHANATARLMGDPRAYAHARAAIRTRLASVSTAPRT